MASYHLDRKPSSLLGGSSRWVMIKIIHVVTAQKKVIIMLENVAHDINVRSLFNEGR